MSAQLHEVLDSVESLDEEDHVSRPNSPDEEIRHSKSTSSSGKSLKGPMDDKSIPSQDLHEEDYEGYAESVVDEDGFDDERSDVGELPSGDNDEDCLSRRKNFKKLLQSMESENDLKTLYPTSISAAESHEGCDEKQILREFIQINAASIHSSIEAEESDFEQLEVHEFVVYRAINHSKGFNGQLEYLHNVARRVKEDFFSLDGIVCSGGEKRKAIDLEIVQISFGGLNDVSMHTTVDQTWVQTRLSKAHNDTWYRLCTPATEYHPYWVASRWISDFNKHVFEYLCEASEDGKQVRLTNFASCFWEQIQGWHGNDKAFKSWHSLCGAVTDFRKLLIRHGQFLYDRAGNLYDAEDLTDILDHPLWHDMGITHRGDENAMPLKKTSKKPTLEEQTIVTENIAATFLESFPAWGPEKYKLLLPTPMSAEVAAGREQRMTLLGMSNGQPSHHIEQPDNSNGKRQRKVSQVELVLEKAGTVNRTTHLSAAELVGKVVVVRLDNPADAVLSRARSKMFDFAWISEIVSFKKLHAVWLALPAETLCGHPDYERTFYPAGNELFFTDLCEVITISKVVGAFDAAIFGQQAQTTSTICVRQLYLETENAFITAQEDKLQCTCRESKPSKTDHQPVETAQQHPKEQVKPMKNVSLFCGAGLLDGALEESGTFETVMAIDNCKKAIKSHIANTTHGVCDHRAESVNHVLEAYLRGDEKLPSQANSIIAGCPCPGYSRANTKKYTENGQRNCSMLAHTLSWVELLLPEYVIIENVPSMDSNPPRKGIANACCQAIACLVAMGYQVRKMVLEGFRYGHSTKRQRLFLVAAAPYYALPKLPSPTHGEEEGLKPVQTIRHLFKALPTVHNDTQVNLSVPDHLPIQRLKQHFGFGVGLRNVVRRIPKTSRGGSGHKGAGLRLAYDRRRLSKQQEHWYERKSKAQTGLKSLSLCRVEPDGLLPTITTVISPMCAFISGRVIHYDEDRTMTLQEFRLAQGIPDWFLLIGNIREQVRQVGNGVAWQMAAALGRSLSKAWTESVSGGKVSEPHADEGQTIIDSTEHLNVQDISALSSRLVRATSILGHSVQEDRMRSRSQEAVGRHDPISKLKQEQEDAFNRITGWKSESSLFRRTSLHRNSFRQKHEDTYDTIVVKSPTPIRNKITAQIKKEHEVTTIGDDRRSGSTLQNRGSTASTKTRVDTVEELEFSDHESLDVTPNGTMKYRHAQRAKYTKTTRQPVYEPKITVEIPARKRRASTPDEGTDGDDLMIIESRSAVLDATKPVFKKKARRGY